MPGEHLTLDHWLNPSSTHQSMLLSQELSIVSQVPHHRASQGLCTSMQTQKFQILVASLGGRSKDLYG